MIEGRELESIVNLVINGISNNVDSVIRYKKWRWGVRLVTSGVTILALLVFLKYLANVRW